MPRIKKRINVKKKRSPRVLMHETFYVVLVEGSDRVRFKPDEVHRLRHFGFTEDQILPLKEKAENYEPPEEEGEEEPVPAEPTG